jgi:CelD/BcsL family acetyltransferase involved in cellulose biosynthesis
MTTLTVTAVESLGDVHRAWDDLVDLCPSPSPFVRSWWVEGMGAGEGGTLRVPLVFDAGQLVGGIPLVRDRLERTLPRLRSIEGSDYVDVVALPGRETEVVAALRRWLRGQRAVIDLACVVPGSLAIDLVPYPRWTLSQEPSPYEQLPETYEAYLKARSSRWRANVGQAQRAADRQGWTVRCVDRSDVGAAFERLADLHVLQFQHSPFVKLRERFARAARGGAAQGELFIFELLDGDSTIASQVWFQVGGCASYYQGGRLHDVPSAGTILIAAAIEHACRGNQSMIDLLGGGTTYKAHWAHQARCLHYLRGATGHVLPRVVAALAKRRDWVPWQDAEPPEPQPWPPP